MIDLNEIENSVKYRMGEFVFNWLAENNKEETNQELNDFIFLQFLFDSILDNEIMFYLYVNDNLELVDYINGKIVFNAKDDNYDFLEGALFK